MKGGGGGGGGAARKGLSLKYRVFLKGGMGKVKKNFLRSHRKGKRRGRKRARGLLHHHERGAMLGEEKRERGKEVFRKRGAARINLQSQEPHLLRDAKKKKIVNLTEFLKEKGRASNRKESERQNSQRREYYKTHRRKGNEQNSHPHRRKKEDNTWVPDS